MSRLVIYDNKLLFDKEISCKLSHEIGRGSEGICYEHGDKAYKVLFSRDDMVCDVLDYMVHPDKIITTEVIDLPSFAFPKKLYVTKDWLLGYKAKLIKNNLFKEEIFHTIEDLKGIDFNALAMAYKKMLSDVDVLSEEKVKIYDLTFNLIFDGTNLTGIDTCGYERVKEDIKRYNRDCLATSVDFLFCTASDYELQTCIMNDDIESYLEEVDKQLRI